MDRSHEALAQLDVAYKPVNIEERLPSSVAKFIFSYGVGCRKISVSVVMMQKKRKSDI